MSHAVLAPVINGTASPRPANGIRGGAGASRIGITLMPEEARHIDQQFSDIRELLVRIDTKLEGTMQKAADHETRLRAVEERAPQGLKEQVDSLRQWRAQAVGAALILSAVIPTIITLALRNVS